MLSPISLLLSYRPLRASLTSGRCDRRILRPGFLDCERIVGVSRAEELLTLPVGELAERVASAQAEPGAGAVAAVCASLAAALVAMAATASCETWAEAGGVAAQAEALRRRAGSLASENASI